MIEQEIMISEQLLIQNNLILLSIAVSLYFLLFGSLIVTSQSWKFKLVIFIIFFNPYIYHQISNDPYSAIKILLLYLYLSLFIRKQYQKLITNKSINFNSLQLLVQVILIGIGNSLSTIVIGANIFMVGDLFMKKQRDNKQLIRNLMIKCMVLIIGTAVIVGYNHYFMETRFQISLNMVSILLSHTFTRYLFINQAILMLCPYFTIILLLFVPSPPQLKLTLCYFFLMFCSIELKPHNEILPLIGLYFLEGWSFKTVMCQFQQKISCQPHNKASLSNQHTILNVLLSTVWCVSVVGYFIFVQFQWLYENTHIAGVSYLTVGPLVFWIAHTVYLSETVAIQTNLSGKQNKKEGMKNWLVKSLRQM